MCEFTNNCPITKLTRSFCSSCRLKKCFALGMDSALIRNIPQSNRTSKKIRQISKIAAKKIALPMVRLIFLENTFVIVFLFSSLHH